MERILRFWDDGVIGQLARFGIAGGICTFVYSTIYLEVATNILPRNLSVLAVLPAFTASASLGFYLHGRWSFRSYGNRDWAAERLTKFLMVQGAGLCLNCPFTWTLAGLLQTPLWYPLVPSVLLTPVVTFVIQRNWVFS